MIYCDLCDKQIASYEELHSTPDFKQLHSACLAKAIIASLEWRSSPQIRGEDFPPNWLDHLFKKP